MATPQSRALWHSVPATQDPNWHVLPCPQEVPFCNVGFEQAPVAGSQVPAEWHASMGVQVTPTQRSPPVPQVVPVVLSVPSFVVCWEVTVIGPLSMTRYTPFWKYASW